MNGLVVVGHVVVVGKLGGNVDVGKLGGSTFFTIACLGRHALAHWMMARSAFSDWWSVRIYYN